MPIFPRSYNTFGSPVTPCSSSSSSSSSSSVSSSGVAGVGSALAGVSGVAGVGDESEERASLSGRTRGAVAGVWSNSLVPPTGSIRHTPLPEQELCELAARILFMGVKWAKCVPAFVSLPLTDQVRASRNLWHYVRSIVNECYRV